MNSFQTVPLSMVEFTKPFNNCFSHNQHTHFQQYLSGLVIGKDKNILKISEFIDHASTYDNLHHFISNSKWDWKNITNKMVEMIKENKHLKPLPTGWLVIDDVLIDKTGKHIEKVGKFFDHSENKYLDYAHCLVQLWYTDARGIGYPLTMEMYIKHSLVEDKDQFKTKHLIAKELVKWAIGKGLDFQGVLFDGWYLNNDLIDFIEENHKTWISRMKSNRLIRVKGKNISVSEYRDSLTEKDFTESAIKDRKFRFHSKCFPVKSLNNNKTRLVFVQEYDWKKKTWTKIVIIATNQITWHSNKIIKSYLLRWSIEVFFRDSKQHLGLGSYQMRKLTGIKRHWCLVSLAYVFLQKVKLESSLLKKLSHQLKTVGQMCSYYKDQITEMIIHFAYRQFQDNKKPDEIIKALKLDSPLLVGV